jgi:hypothetical protein
MNDLQIIVSVPKGIGWWLSGLGVREHSQDETGRSIAAELPARERLKPAPILKLKERPTPGRGRLPDQASSLGFRDFEERR